jgi:DNA-binding CsgD family transcriptional regulator
MTRDEIGRRYRLSPHTVRTHINHVLHKLGVHSTLAAVALANKSQASR